MASDMPVCGLSWKEGMGMLQILAGLKLAVAQSAMAFLLSFFPFSNGTTIVNDRTHAAQLSPMCATEGNCNRCCNR
jgi:hypothetical protein